MAFRDILVLFSMKTLLTLAMAAASSTALTTVGVSGARLITYCVGGGGHLSLLTVEDPAVTADCYLVVPPGYL
ncbi:hypothetical protein AZ55_14495 [Mycobacterium tuberculosis CWCFVRF MDRTB 670]|nr:hypothetical protein AZ55_14495 [Mycobacterium tuberculosis CWCFVRF MDRTB 670]